MIEEKLEKVEIQKLIEKNEEIRKQKELLDKMEEEKRIKIYEQIMNNQRGVSANEVQQFQDIYQNEPI